jgi:hypothetical protein
MKIDLLDIVEVMNKKGYVIDEQPFKPNIVGIRSANMEPNKFDDKIALFYSDKDGLVSFHIFDATTDPGLYYLNEPLNVDGTAILCEGQYVDAYAIDKHKNQYRALCQRLKAVKVYRDADRDNLFDVENAKTQTGYFGINIHHAGIDSKQVDKWSAGCQVLKRLEDFNSLMAVCEKSARLNGNVFSYTLINEKDFEENPS